MKNQLKNTAISEFKTKDTLFLDLLSLRNYKTLLSLVFLLLFTLNSESLFSTTNNNYLASSGIKVISSTPQYLIISYKPKLLEVKQKLISDNLYFEPIFVGTQNLYSTNNSPKNQVINCDITLPSQSGFKIRDIKVTKINSIDGVIVPFETGYGISAAEVNINETYNNYQNTEWAELSYKGIARDRYAGNLLIIAARYNNIENKIELPEEITITIEFTTQSTKNEQSELNKNKNFKNESNIDFNTLNENVVNEFKTYRDIDNNNENTLYNLVKNYTTNNTLNSNSNSNLSPNSKNSNKIQSVNNNNWYKIEIPINNFYRITAAQISSMGFDFNKEDFRTIKIFGNGGRHLNEKPTAGLLNLHFEHEKAIETNADGSLNSIVFFGETNTGFRVDNESKYEASPQNSVRNYINPFSKKVYYLLTWGGEKGKEASYRTNNNPTVNIPKSYVNRVFYNEETTMVFGEGSGRIFVGRNNLNEPFRTKLPNLVKNGDILYRCQVVNKDTIAGFFTFKENGNIISANRMISGQGTSSNSVYTHGHYNEFSFEGKAVNVLNDESILKIDYSKNRNFNSGIAYFDYLEIHYPRELKAINNRIELFTDKELKGVTEYNFTGFDNSPKYGIDITNIQFPSFVKNNSTDNNSFSFKTDLNGDEPRRFFISSDPVTNPQIVKIENINLRNNFANTDVIVVTNKVLMASALEFKKYREANSNLTVNVVDVEHIYNEFACGMSDPTAIRDFLAFAMQNWQTKPQYLLLWGKGHFDYRNITTNVVSFVPTYQIDSPFRINETPAFNEISSSNIDDYFGRIVGNDPLIDINIGRIQIDAPKVGFEYLKKLEHYEKKSLNGKWRSNIILLADDGPAGNKSNDGSTHINQTESLSTDYVPSTFYNTKIYLPDFATTFLSSGNNNRRKPSVTNALIKSINEDGGLIFNFIGHGNPKLMTHENVFDRDRDIPLLNNYDKLFLLVAATCDYAKYDNPNYRCGTSEMLLSTKGGAIAVVAATRVVFSSGNSDLNDMFYQNLFTLNSKGEYPTLGQAMYKVKQGLNDDNAEKYSIFGDPTMRLLLPKYNVKVNTMNSVSLDSLDKNTTLKALSSNKFAGVVLSNDGKTINTNFNGKVNLTIYDADLKLSVKDEVNTYSYSKYGGLLSDTKGEVVNGVFEVEFVLPKDVSFEDNPIRINLLATNDNNEHGLGEVNKFIVNGIDNSVKNDLTGPEIKPYMNHKNFENGGIVGTSSNLLVELFDPIGINSTGNGIGRKIEAWLDDSPNSIDLTNTYKSDANNYRFGIAQKVLDNLSPGEHTIKVRAWDVFNNFSVNSVSFVVKSDLDGIVLNNAISYPNPFDNYTRITFSHNVTPPFDIELNIYNTVGSLVKNIMFNQYNNQSFEYLWDATDNNGTLIPIGNYFYSVKFNNELINNQSSFGGSLIYIK